MKHTLYDIPLATFEGRAASLADYRGEVLLIVNVASSCSLTPQNAGLQALFETYRDCGLQVLGFPCNDFAGQDAGSTAEIR